nr:unnamed protein product [Spirometra erinaceieuropaei]
MSRNTEEIQGYADCNESKNFLAETTPIYGSATKTNAQLVGPDGSTLLSQILRCWVKHFKSVLNRPSTISNAAIGRLPKVEIDVDQYLSPFLPETILAVKQPFSGKASGFKAAENSVTITEASRYSTSPGRTSPLSSSIASPDTSSKDFCRKANVDSGRPPVIREVPGHVDSPLHPPPVVDLMRAFDTVSREELWRIMQKFDCPERFTHIVRQSHDVMMKRVTDNGAISEVFTVTNGVKQGYVLAPTLFGLVFSAMLRDPRRLQDRWAPSQRPANAGPDTSLHNYYQQSDRRRRLHTQVRH